MTTSSSRFQTMRVLVFLLFSATTPASVLSWVAPVPNSGTARRSFSSSSSALCMSSTNNKRGKLAAAAARQKMTAPSTRHYSTTTTTSESFEDLLVPEESQKKLNTALLVWFLPLINAISAFFLYTRTQMLFHNVMDSASGHLWVNVDGNVYMSDIVKPVLNGPVTLSISILFGTLISMTIQTLYRRQIALHQTLISTVEEVRELQWLVEGFPEPYKTNSHNLLAKFLRESFQDFETQSVTPESLRTKEMTQMLVLLNDLSKQGDDCPDIIVCEAYGCVHRLKDRRAEFMSGLQTVFSTAHYVVIGLLATTLLFVFLLETDNDTLQFLLDFQLSICWALLIGSYSMLAAIIYDLSNPFSGIFTTMKGVDFVAHEKATEVVPDIIAGGSTTARASLLVDEEWDMALTTTIAKNGVRQPAKQEECELKGGGDKEAEWC